MMFATLTDLCRAALDAAGLADVQVVEVGGEMRIGADKRIVALASAAGEPLFHIEQRIEDPFAEDPAARQGWGDGIEVHSAAAAGEGDPFSGPVEEGWQPSPDHEEDDPCA